MPGSFGDVSICFNDVPIEFVVNTQTQNFVSGWLFASNELADYSLDSRLIQVLFYGDVVFKFPDVSGGTGITLTQEKKGNCNLSRIKSGACQKNHEKFRYATHSDPPELYSKPAKCQFPENWKRCFRS